MRRRRSWRTRTHPDIAKNAVCAAHVRIQADRNMVTLSGRVDTRAERQEAERAVRFCPGITRADNRLVVAR
jgi:osmotically-inducible protein OsmY